MTGRQSARHQGHPSQARPTEGGPEAVVIQRVLPGRTRFRVPSLYRASPLKRRIEVYLVGIRGIVRVQASVLTANVLVVHASDMTDTQILGLIGTALGRELTAVPEAASTATGSRNGLSLSLPSTSDLLTWVGSLQPARRAATTVDRDVEGPPRQPWHQLSARQATEELQTPPAAGLSTELATARLQRYGHNAFPPEERRSELLLLLEQFMTLPVGLLGASAAVSLATGGVVDAAVIALVVAINATIGYLTERNAERTISALGRYTPRSALVLRDGVQQEIPFHNVALGDLLVLAPGTEVAADARLLQTQRLSVDEAALTGESDPVLKNAAAAWDAQTPLADRTNMVHRGTLITGGSGLGLVVATGRHTELGVIRELAGAAQTPETPMQKQLGRMGTQLALLSGAVCVGVFGVGLLRGYGLLEMLVTSTSLAVAAVPEGLPAVATTALALGIQRMRGKRVLIRHLDAVETLGSVQVFCLDKTGTLTMNRMAVLRVNAGLQPLTVEHGRFLSDGQPVDPRSNEELQRLLFVATLCNESEQRWTEDDYVLTGSATESALLDMVLQAGIDVADLRRRFRRVEVQYRAEGRHYMSTLHQTDDGRRLLAIKGSPEQVLALCRWRMVDGKAVALDEPARAAIMAANEAMAGDALRVLGIAYRELDHGAAAQEDGLTWLGLVGMADPLRSGMKELTRVFHNAGIKTVMITGDQSSTAYAIARQLDLTDGDPVEILESTQLDRLDPELAAGLVQKVRVFARVSPAHKLRIVQALQKGGTVVAMTGDGINDSPALKAANIGVAMGRSGSDVARSVAGVVLEDDDLGTMVVAVRQGRTIYANIRKALHFLLATNLTEIELVLAGVALGAGQPLTPMQLLWINLISDVFPGLALSLEPPQPDVLTRPPRDPSEPILRRRDFARMGLESAAITAGAVASYGYAFARYGAGAQAGSQAFMTLTLGQLLHALSCRSEERVLFADPPLPSNRYLNWALGASFAAQLAAVAVPWLRKLLGITPIGVLDAAVMGAGAVVPLLVNEATKERGTPPSASPTVTATATTGIRTVLTTENNGEQPP